MNQLGYQHTLNSLTHNMELIRAREGEIFIAEIDSAIVGVIAAIIDVRLAEGEVGEIVSLVVSELFRGKGIGKALIQHAEHWLMARVDHIRVRANQKRHQAHAFYQSLGYSINKSQVVMEKSVRT